jgi:hypothetical protein
MKPAGEPTRSIAIELALLSVRQLESKVEQDPELLVSTEAVLSFAAIRGTHSPAWQRWRRILEKYGKSDLMDYMLDEPITQDQRESASAADRLTALVLESGIEFFHDPDQRGWACIRVEGHWENHPIRSRPFQLFLLRTYYRETGNSPRRASHPLGAGAVRGQGPV